MKLIVVLLFFLHALLKGQADITIRSPRVTNYGIWGNLDKCPKGKFAVGFSLKTEPDQGPGEENDDTALNAIKLLCHRPGEHSNTFDITSLEGQFGNWGSRFYCEGLMIGFRLRSKEDLQGGRKRDDTAANNLIGYCATPNPDRQQIEGDGVNFGDWTAKQTCLSRQAVCGIRTQVEPYQGWGGDDTSLNNVDMECCDIEDPAAVCKPKDKWETIVSQDNTLGVTPMIYTYYEKTGVGTSSTESSGGSVVEQVMSSVGFDLGLAYSILSANFGVNLQTSSVTTHEWKSETTRTWAKEVSHKIEFEIPVGVKTELFQIVGTCDYFNVFATKFKKVDEFANGTKSTFIFLAPERSKAVSVSMSVTATLIMLIVGWLC